MIADATAPALLDPWRRPRRSLGWAGLVSIGIHAMLALLVMGIVVRAPSATPPIRVLLYNATPPPPPPAAATAPSRVAAGSPVEPATHPKAAIRQPVLRVRHRAVRRPKPEPAHAAEPATAAVASTTGEPTGVSGGVTGGVPGGRVGGVVGASGHDLISADAAAYRPVPISKVMPEYPPIAKLRGIQGQVLLEAILAADGHVEPNITVLHSVPLLDNAAVTALRQWRFRPARDKDGVPVRVTFRVPVRFQLR